MRPFLREGDHIGVEWLAAGEAYEPRAGELVLAREPSGGWIVHRVVRSDAAGFSVKGDAALAWDSFEPGQIWARVVTVEPSDAGRTHAIRLTPLDQIIARLSHVTLSWPRPAAALARRAVYLLGAARRHLL